MATMISAITDVWTAIMQWITTSLASVQTVFYSEGALTFLGVTAVISVAIGISFLIFTPIGEPVEQLAVAVSI